VSSLASSRRPFPLGHHAPSRGPDRASGRARTTHSPKSTTPAPFREAARRPLHKFLLAYRRLTMPVQVKRPERRPRWRPDGGAGIVAGRRSLARATPGRRTKSHHGYSRTSTCPSCPQAAARRRPGGPIESRSAICTRIGQRSVSIRGSRGGPSSANAARCCHLFRMWARQSLAFPAPTSSLLIPATRLSLGPPSGSSAAPFPGPSERRPQSRPPPPGSCGSGPRRSADSFRVRSVAVRSG